MVVGSNGSWEHSDGPLLQALVLILRFTVPISNIFLVTTTTSSSSGSIASGIGSGVSWAMASWV